MSNSARNNPADGNPPAKPSVLFTWPNALLLLTLAAGCYLLVSNDRSELPRYIQVIQALGHCVWLMPFALFYNVEGTRLARKLYISANLLFVSIIFLLYI